MDSSQAGSSIRQVPGAASSSERVHLGEGLTEELIEAFDDPEKLRKLFVSFFRKVNLTEKEFETSKTELWNKYQEEFISQEKVVRDELYKSVYGAMEQEFSCTVCTELYIEPTVLDCSHTFCHYCIKKWISTRGNHSCPICRKSTYRPLTKHGGISSFVAKVCTMMSPEIREQRDQVVREREELARSTQFTMAVLGQQIIEMAISVINLNEVLENGHDWGNGTDSDSDDADLGSNETDDDEDWEDYVSVSWDENRRHFEDTRWEGDTDDGSIGQARLSERDVDWGPGSPASDAVTVVDSRPAIDTDSDDGWGWVPHFHNGAVVDVRHNYYEIDWINAQLRRLRRVRVGIPSSSTVAEVSGNANAEDISMNAPNSMGVIDTSMEVWSADQPIPTLNGVFDVIGVYDNIEVRSTTVLYSHRIFPITWINRYTFHFNVDNQNEQIWTYDISMNALHQICNHVPSGMLENSNNRHSPCSTITEVPRNYGNFRGVIINEEAIIGDEDITWNITWINPLAFYFKLDEGNEQVWIYDQTAMAYLELGPWKNSVKDAFSHNHLYTYRKQ